MQILVANRPNIFAISTSFSSSDISRLMDCSDPFPSIARIRHIIYFISKVMKKDKLAKFVLTLTRANLKADIPRCS